MYNIHPLSFCRVWASLLLCDLNCVRENIFLCHFEQAGRLAYVQFLLIALSSLSS